MPKPRRREDWYGEYLASDHWIRTRDLKLASAGYRCERCGEWGRRLRRLGQPSIGLNVHHLNYERVPGGELPTDLEVVCGPCHDETHGKPVDAVQRERWRREVARWIAARVASVNYIGDEDIAGEVAAWDRVADSG